MITRKTATRRDPARTLPEDDPRVELRWIPLGAGQFGGVVRCSGRCYEAVVARRDRRPPQQLFHSALEVHLAGCRWVVEMAPTWSLSDPFRGVVAEGPVGSRALGRSRLFRYEVRRWQHGRVPDAAFTVGEPHRVSSGPQTARMLLELVPAFPTLVWGRDELGAGDMWNSNSLTSWLLAGSGVVVGDLRPPDGGRAPGWSAGLAASRTLTAR